MTCSPLPPVVFTKLFELEIGEALAQLARRIVHRSPWHIVARIEIEHDAVGVLDIVDGRAPHMDLQHARLHQREQAVEILDRKAAPRHERRFIRWM